MLNSADDRWVVHVGDCRDVLAAIPDASIDSVVCDPPYELAFMGKRWDAAGVAYDVTVWAEVLRVLKPGGHLLAFGGTRTYHRMACAVEDAGFDIRDSIHWIYGSGFPKSHNLSGDWDGWGTALKPAHEPIVVARKPLVGTVAANVLAYGTGALNVDGCRVAGKLEGDPTRFAKTDGGAFAAFPDRPPQVRSEGRWPANLILTHHPDCQPTGTTSEPVGGGAHATSGFATGYEHGDGWTGRTIDATVWDCHPDCPAAVMGDHGDGAARYFTQTTPDSDGLSFRYSPKAAKRERDAGLDERNPHPTVKPVAVMEWLVRLVTPPGGIVLDPFTGSGTTGIAATRQGFRFVGIEQDADYAAIAATRIRYHTDRVDTVNAPHTPPDEPPDTPGATLTLFDH